MRHLLRLGLLESKPDLILTWDGRGLVRYMTELIFAREQSLPLDDLRPGENGVEPLHSPCPSFRALLSQPDSCWCGWNREVRELKVKIKRWKTQLEEIMAGDPAVIILQSIPGIALWSAIAIRLEIGDFADFPRAAGLVAYSGLDPTPKSSGDGHSTGVISKRGSSNLRAVLFMCAFVACTGKIQDPSKKPAGEDSGNEEEALKNRVFRSFYQRLRARGKSHKFALTASMGKMLRLAHSCVRNGELYSADRHETQTGKPRTTAPVSKKEKKKRATAVPQESKGSRKGGPGIALVHPRANSAEKSKWFMKVSLATGLCELVLTAMRISSRLLDKTMGYLPICPVRSDLTPWAQCAS